VKLNPHPRRDDAPRHVDDMDRYTRHVSLLSASAA
jgi:hypothetical protein